MHVLTDYSCMTFDCLGQSDEGLLHILRQNAITL